MRALKSAVPSAVKKDSSQFAAICRELLQKGFSVRFTAQGESMRPNILPNDQVLVAPVPVTELKPGQVTFCILAEAATDEPNRLVCAGIVAVTLPASRNFTPAPARPGHLARMLKGAVSDPGLLALVDRHDHRHLMALGDLLHQLDGRARHRLGGVVPATILARAEVRPVEDFLQTQDLHAVLAGLVDHRQVLLEHRRLDLGDRLRLVVDRIACLDEAGDQLAH